MHVRNKPLLLVVLFLSISVVRAQNYSQYQWTVYDTANKSVSDNFICDIVFDKQGTAWVTTGGLSLNKYANGKWVTVKSKTADSLVNGWFKKIIIQPSGEFLILGVPGKLTFYNPINNKWRYENNPDNVQFLQGAINKNGNILLGGNTSRGGCLFEYSKNSFHLLQDTLGDIFTIQMVENDNALVSFRNGTFRYFKNPNGTYSKLANKISNLAFYSLKKDHNNTIWGTSFSPMKLQYFSNNEWYAVNNIPESVYYDFNGSWQYCSHTLNMLNNGNKIMGTQFGAHLAIEVADTWQTFHLPILEFDGVATVTVAPDSSIWVGTWHHGIYVFSSVQNTQHKKIDTQSLAPRHQQQIRQITPTPPAKPKVLPFKKMRAD
ncbi:MAG: hypothetical protein IT244_07930 [Bacteroidia bacterium]|nr:hypothetical protein [Bacteroidia bacterium]